jgi:hypothetical protein
MVERGTNTACCNQERRSSDTTPYEFKSCLAQPRESAAFLTTLFVKGHVQYSTHLTLSAFWSSSLRARHVTFKSRCMIAADRPPASLNVHLDNIHSLEEARTTLASMKPCPSSPQTTSLHSTPYRYSYSRLQMALISYITMD